MDINGIEEAKKKAAAMFMHFSDILKKDVLDSEGKFVGNVWDMSLKLGEVYPKAGDIIIRKGFLNGLYTFVECVNISSIDDDITIAKKSSDLVFSPSTKEYEFLARRDILDQQVVDTYNHKVRRVNDLHLLKVDHELVVAHVDIGLRSLIYRIGWNGVVDFFVKRVNKNSKYLTTEDLISWKYVQPVSINPASMTMKLSFPQKQLLSIPAADLGEIIFDLNPNQRMALFKTLDVKTKAKIFEHLEFEDQKAIFKELDKKEAAGIVAGMSPDEAADLLERLPQAAAKNLLTLIESSRAKKLSTLLGYSSDSAGGLMTTEFVSIQESMAVERALDHVKNETREFEFIPYIYIVDDTNRLKGITTVRRLLMEDPKQPVIKTVYPKTIHVYLSDTVREVAYLMDKYKISAIPVLDENKVLQGVIAMDDILSQVISIAWRRRPKAAKGI